MTSSGNRMAGAESAESEQSPVALVTGGGTGIGRACCEALAGEGFRVAVHYNTSERSAAEVAEGLPGAFTLGADLADTVAVDQLVADIRERTGRLDVLVNNAAANCNAPTATMKIDEFDAVASVGRGTWYLTKLVLRRFMLRAGSGRIVNISSVVGHTGNAGQAPYTMQKAGLDAMTKSLAQELGGRGILINSVAPGFIDTAMTRDLPEEIRSRVLGRIPLERLGRASEVADAVAFLATRADYVTGSVLHVNGGMYGG